MPVHVLTLGIADLSAPDRAGVVGLEALLEVALLPFSSVTESMRICVGCPSYVDGMYAQDAVVLIEVGEDGDQRLGDVVSVERCSSSIRAS